jgi:Fe-S-cluster containining protein
METAEKNRPVFECQQCGDCCNGRGGIYVKPQEVEDMAAFLGLDVEEFISRYVDCSAQGSHLGVQDGVCVFMEDNRCRVHPVKPFICRQWPFFPALLLDPEELEYAKGACPGIDPDCTHEDFIDAARRRGDD